MRSWASMPNRQDAFVHGPCDPGRPCPTAKTLDGFPGSHGPPEERMNEHALTIDKQPPAQVCFRTGDGRALPAPGRVGRGSRPKRDVRASGWLTDVQNQI